jgi:hypothetical protein
MVDDDEILSVEDAWYLHLTERFGDKLTEREERSIAQHYERLKLQPPGFEADREALRRYRQCGGDIVHRWDNPDDYGVWASAFKVLKPPRE